MENNTPRKKQLPAFLILGIIALVAAIVLGREKAMALLDEAGLNGVLVTRDRQVYIHRADEQFTLEVQPDVTVH